MIIITRSSKDDYNKIVEDYEKKNYRLQQVSNEEDVVTLYFLEPNEAKPPTIQDLNNELSETKNELSSTQIALSDVYEQLVLLQDQLNSLKGDTNNG